MSRTGKIARLPHSLQDELNQRLEDNLPGPQILAWLNAHPGVQTVLRDHFQSEPVNEQNLSNWRTGGFAEWQCRQDFLAELRAFSADAARLESALSPMAGHAARLLSLQFALTMAAGESGTGLDLNRVAALKPLFTMARAVAALRQLEQRDALIQERQARTCTCGCSCARARARSSAAPVVSPDEPLAVPPPKTARKTQRSKNAPPSPPVPRPHPAAAPALAVSGAGAVAASGVRRVPPEPSGSTPPVPAPAPPAPLSPPPLLPAAIPAASLESPRVASASGDSTLIKVDQGKLAATAAVFPGCPAPPLLVPRRDYKPWLLQGKTRP